MRVNSGTTRTPPGHRDKAQNSGTVPAIPGRLATMQIDDVDGPIANTSIIIHGAITSLSPVKKGGNSNFFDRTLADETSKIQVVGFDVQQQRKLNNYHQKNIHVELIN